MARHVTELSLKHTAVLLSAAQWTMICRLTLLQRLHIVADSDSKGGLKQLTDEIAMLTNLHTLKLHAQEAFRGE